MQQIVVKNLSKSYVMDNGKKLNVLNNISFEVNDREFICILGPSGCGKSTILNAIAGLIEYQGQVFFPNYDECNRPRIGYVFQTPRLLPWMTVQRNIEFVLKANDFSPSEYNRISINLIEAVGLEGFADAFPHQLSEGMRARVGLARALAIEPSILLFDEPFSHVDELTARNLRTEILSLWEKSKQTVIFVTHNPREAAILADHIHILSDKPTSITHSLLISIPRPRSPENMEVVEIIKEIYSLLDGRKEAADA